LPRLVRHQLLREDRRRNFRNAFFVMVHSSHYEWQIGRCCSCRPTTQLRHQQVVWQQKRDLTASVQRRRRALDFDIELQEPIEQRGLPKEVASGISVAQGCVVSVLKQAEPEQRSEDSCLHRH